MRASCLGCKRNVFDIVVVEIKLGITDMAIDLNRIKRYLAMLTTK